MRDGRVLLLANPAAQRGHGVQAAETAYELFEHWLGGSAVDLAFTEKPGHAVELARGAARGRYATIVAVGGDGLVHEVVNGLMQGPQDKRPVFGLIPSGSGNDFAQTLGMSTSVPDAVVQFLTAQERTFDVGCCNDEFFAETLSFGLDAAIALDTVSRRERTGEQGARLYLASGLGQLLHHLDEYRFTARVDEGRVFSGTMLMFAVQNGPTYGGGFRICPDADPADGILDICYAQAPMSVPEATFKFLRAKNGRHVKHKGIMFERASRMELQFDACPPCQIDGEPMSADSYSISVLHGALNVLCAEEGKKGKEAQGG